MPIKFNPATGRYENYNSQDGSYLPIGPAGQPVWNPNQFKPTGAPTTTAPAPTTTTPRTPAGPSGSPRGRDNRQSGEQDPRRVRPPATPSGPASPTTTAPRATTTTAPRATTTTAPAPTTTIPQTTTTTAPKRPVAPSVPAGYKGVSPTASTREAAGAKTRQEDTDTVNTALEEAFNSGDLTTVMNLLKTVYGGGGGGSDTAVDYANAYRSGIAGARQQELSAQQAQQAYQRAGQSVYDTQMANIEARYAPQMTALENYYTTQSTAATDAINKAAQDALANIKDPTAFANLQALVGAAPQQGLGADLAAYGATGGLAQQQAGTDEAYNKFIADLQNRSYQTTQAANQDYSTALKNAITGSQAGALQGLTQAVTGLRAQDVANLRGARQQDEGSATAARDALIQAGLESLLSGQQTAAATRADTEQKYGAYKPKKKSGKKKSS
jgi:hypothetical protein